jgi:hypothetical protein
MSEYYMNDGTPSGWTDDEWQDFEEYMECLSDEEYAAEIKWIESLAQAKMEGKNIVENQSYYLV